MVAFGASRAIVTLQREGNQTREGIYFGSIDETN